MAENVEKGNMAENVEKGNMAENVEKGKYRSIHKAWSGIELGSCQLCPNWMFSSKTEKTRHYSLLHSTTKVKESESSKHTCTSGGGGGGGGGYHPETCTYKDYGLHFQTYHSLA